MATALMYATRWCPFCVAARRLLDSLGVDFDEIDVADDPGRRAEMVELSGRHTVPQIWIGDRHVGGFDDLNELYHTGKLERLLAEVAPAARTGND
jgi:glutaredoxin 3